MKTAIERLEELKAALRESVETVRHAQVLGQHVMNQRANKWEMLAASQAELLPERQHKMHAIQAYVSQLESVLFKVISDGGPRAEEAKLLFSQEILYRTGMERDTRPRKVFSLDDPCPETETGQHEPMRDGGRVYCIGCGSSKYERAS